jgi:hypothetical protein
MKPLASVKLTSHATLSESLSSSVPKISSSVKASNDKLFEQQIPSTWYGKTFGLQLAWKTCATLTLLIKVSDRSRMRGSH